MFGKKKTQNLKSSYLCYFMEKKSWNLKCKFKDGFSIVLYKKTVFFDFMQKKVFWDLSTVQIARMLVYEKYFNTDVSIYISHITIFTFAIV